MDFAADKNLFSQWPIIDSNGMKRPAKGKSPSRRSA
jgi:hypothetical protein